MDKISITAISKSIEKQKGFDSRGCYNCKCNDSCCKFGCDVDKESYELIQMNKELIEKEICDKLENCFEEKFSDDPEYLGGNSVMSKIGKSGFCKFHKINGRGCILYDLAIKKNINRRIIPSICRLFPISWENGKLCLHSELEKNSIPKCCNVRDKNNFSDKLIFETQKKEIEDIFQFNLSGNNSCN